jgi:hypothetical protein
VSVRSKPLWQSRCYEACSALMLAARRLASQPITRKSRVLGTPLSPPSCLLCVASLQTALAVSNQCSFALQTAQARVPVPHFLDALGQTHNYFTSRAHEVMDRIAPAHRRYQCPAIRVQSAGLQADVHRRAIAAENEGSSHGIPA